MHPNTELQYPHVRQFETNARIAQQLAELRIERRRATCRNEPIILRPLFVLAALLAAVTTAVTIYAATV